MPTLCDPLSHEMDIDNYDIHEWEGQCQKCSAFLTYKWGHDQDQVNKSNIYFGNRYNNYDIGNYSRMDNAFGILSDVDNDPKLSKGVFIIPYTSVTVIALKDGVQTTTTDIFNPTYEKLKSDYDDHGFIGANLVSWEKSVVVNDSWLKTNFSAAWSAINKQYI